jgi:hypothetical protein
VKALATESLGYYELKQYKSWFYECSKLLDQRKPVKLHWFQNVSQTNGGNLKNIGRETSRIVREKKWEYLKEKFNETETNSKNKNIRD